MKYVIRVILIFLPLLAHAQDNLATCANIESAVERLDCYDRLANKTDTAREGVETDQAGQDAGVTEDTTPVEVEASSPPPTGKASPKLDRDSVGSFGKAPEKPREQIEKIEARIEKVTKTPLGHHVFTLSNGQVWVQNEPGRRRVHADQDITIRKHRWHYEMELKSGPDVPVHRVE